MPPLWPPTQRVCGWWLRKTTALSVGFVHGYFHNRQFHVTLLFTVVIIRTCSTILGIGSQRKGVVDRSQCPQF